MPGNENANFPVPDENWEVSDVAKRLKSAVENANGNRAVSERSGVPLSTLNGYLAGRDMKASAAAKIARACGVSLEWLLIGEGDATEDGRSGPALSIASQGQSDSVSISFYEDAEPSAGFGRLGVDAPEPKKVSISRFFLDELGLKPNHTIMLKVRGDSMEPTLKTGDRIVLDTSPSSISGVTVFVSSGQLMVKRLSPTASGTIRIISDNDRYPSEEADVSRFRWGEPDGDDAITIIGRVAYRLQALS